MATFRIFAALALVALPSHGQTECASGECGVNFVQLNVAKNLNRKSSEYWYPGRAVDYNRSGYSSALGPWPLPSPAWTYEVAGLNFHQTPCIDEQKNVYTGSDVGKLLSFDVHGVKRWEVDGPAKSCQNPFLFDKKLYTSCSDGSVLSLNMSNGKTIWHKRLDEPLPSDTYSMTATEDYLFLPSGKIEGTGNIGAPHVVLLRRSDGNLLWKYALPEANYTANLAPCMFESSVIFNDVSGGIYHLNLSDGSLIWLTQALSPGSYTLGGVSCSPDNKVFNGFSTTDMKGGLQALDVVTGKRLWTKTFPRAVHNAPAVGKIYNYDRLAVVFGMGEPAGMPLGPPLEVNGTVYAADAETGEILWTFEPAIWNGVGVAGSTLFQVCLPDLFSAATIGQDGTVYINWSAGGVTYALRDANKDGLCDKENPKEVSGIDLGSGATGPPAIAEKMLVVNTCRRPTAFLAD